MNDYFLHEQDMAKSSSSSGSVSDITDMYPFDPSVPIEFFDPMYFEPIVSWEHDMIEVLRAERNREELEWLVRLFTVCKAYPIEGVVPMDWAYPFRQSDYERYVSFLSDPDSDIYEYDGEYYLGPDACYGFEDRDFICLDDDDRSLPLSLWRVFFPPAAPTAQLMRSQHQKQVNKGLMIFL